MVIRMWWVASSTSHARARPGFVLAAAALTSFPVLAGVVLAGVVLAGVAHAQAPTPTTSPAEGPHERWLIERGEVPAAVALPAEFTGAVSVEVPPAEPPPIERARLALLIRLESSIGEARGAAADLDDERALALLVEARALAERAASIPGAARYLAEVEVTLGVVAAQAGLANLADEALRRAVMFDPERVLRAAEAAPALVARSVALSRAVAVAPQGTFRLEADAPAARAFLDDRPLGALPARVEAGVGRHLLRVEAPGRRPWGAVIDVLEGERNPISVALAPTARERRRRQLAAADTPAAAHAALAEAEELLWLEAQADGRALAVRCDARGCASPALLREGDALAPAPILAVADPDATYADARAWLLGPDPQETLRRQRRRRWSGALSAAIVGVAAIAALAWAARPEPDPQLVLTVDLGDVGIMP